MTRTGRLVVTVCSLLTLVALPMLAAADSSARTPVLVELFTSEGCSSCPPADALLLKLDQDQPIAGAEIIVLGQHVDYWDGEGWRDRFSSHEVTERQNGYGRRFKIESVYTPQMVVDGTEQFVGNDAGKARQAIAHASQTPKIALHVAGIVAERQQVSGTVSVAGGAPELPKGELFAALVDSFATTQVRGGENGGRQLKHAGVVRSLVRIGTVQQLRSGPVKFGLVAPNDSPQGKRRVVVFAQGSGQGRVLGATLVDVPAAQAVASR